MEHGGPAAALAGWLAEALGTGFPLAPPPEAVVPVDAAAGAAVAAAVLDQLGLVPCGFRLAPGPGSVPLGGPILEGRLLPDGATVMLDTLRHPRAAPAVLGVLAAPLGSADTSPPAFSAWHPALDIAGWRLREPPDAPGLATADLAGHGFLVAGRRRTALPATAAVALRAAGARGRGAPTDLAASLATAAAAARAAGGLPAGALLAVVLGPSRKPAPGETLLASFGPLGRAGARFV